MELKQFINTLQQSPALRAMVPMNQGMLYPWFTLLDGKLCVHFLTNASNVTPEGMLLHTPAYHVAALYPSGRLLCVESLRCRADFQDVDFSAATLMPKPDPIRKQEGKARMRRLTELVNDVLHQWDETGTADFTAYHELLQIVLTEQQAQMYRKLTGCE